MAPLDLDLIGDLRELPHKDQEMVSPFPAAGDVEPHLTPFQRRVYDIVSTIPKGSVRTYGSIAEELQTSARAVGTAMGRNPYGPSDEVP